MLTTIQATDLTWPALLKQVQGVTTPWVVFIATATQAVQWLEPPSVQATITAITEAPGYVGALHANGALWPELETLELPFYGTCFDTLLLRRWAQPRFLATLASEQCLTATTGPFLCWLATLTHTGLLYFRAQPLNWQQPTPLTEATRFRVLYWWTRLVLGRCT